MPTLKASCCDTYMHWVVHMGRGILFEIRSAKVAKCFQSNQSNVTKASARIPYNYYPILNVIHVKREAIQF